MTTPHDPQPPARRRGVASGRQPLRDLARWALGLWLIATGIAHLTVGREEFLAQVPRWVPVDGDVVVVVSGIAEIVLGVALLVLRRHHHLVGWAAAAFFVAIFPGNVGQYLEGTDGFGLQTDRARFVRLFFQPVFVVWALWSTGAWRAWRASREPQDP